jgi:hypothetical protein
MYSIGWMYENGHGVPVDRAGAVKWYRWAAQAGNERAKKNLTIMGMKW